MASTNKTTHYELSQYIGTDKPSYLGDYNSDMNKIDTGINTAQTTATAADGKADSANTAIGTLSNLTTTDKTNLVSAVNEVDSNADTAQNTANDAYTLADSASRKITALEGALNLTNISSCTVTKSSNISNIFEYNIKCATNNDESLFKLYGNIVLTAPQNTSNGTVTISNTGLGARETAYNIEGSVLSFRNDNEIYILNSTVNTDGSVTISDINFGNSTALRLYLAPILYFNKSFGD